MKLQVAFIFATKQGVNAVLIRLDMHPAQKETVNPGLSVPGFGIPGTGNSGNIYTYYIIRIINYKIYTFKIIL